MKVAVMQPYFLPYLGYFQLIASVDTFIIYDNIKYTKKGWINRNRMLLNGTDVMFSLPLKKDSDSLDIVNRELASEFDQKNLLNQFKGAYGRAPFFSDTFQLLERIFDCDDKNLFHYLHHSLSELCQYLDIPTEIRISSDISIDHELKAQDKVLALCQAANAHTYINAIGGMELYSKTEFMTHGIDLKFINSKTFVYSQYDAPFIPWLSIVDVLMFNSLDKVRSVINSNYELI